MTDDQKVSILLANGWTDYIGNTWIKKSWIADGNPYDMMWMYLDEAFKSVMLEISPHPFDKYHQKALEESKND